MQRNLVINLVFMALAFPMLAQPCYREYFKEGVEAYKDKDYLTALQKFDQAKECPDKPDSEQLLEWNSRAQKAYLAESLRQATDLDSLKTAQQKVDSLLFQLESEVEELKLRQGLGLAQNLAFRSLQTSPDNAILKALLALKAYRIQQELVGSDKDPNIFRSLYYAVKALEGEDFNRLYTGNAAIHFIDYLPSLDQVLTGNNLGLISKWTNDTSWLVVNDSLTNWTVLTHMNSKSPLPIWSMSPDGDWIAAAGPGTQICLWNKATGLHTQLDLHQQNAFRAMTFLPDASSLITAGMDNYINRYELGAIGAEPLMTNGSPITDLTLTQNNTLIYCGMDGLLFSLSIAPTRQLGVLSENFSQRVSKLATAVMKNADGTEQEILIAGLKDGLLKLYKLKEKSIVFFRELYAHRGVITDIQMIDADRLAISSLDGKVSIWEIDQINDPNYQPLLLDDHQWALGMTYIPKANSLLVASQDGSIRHWRLDPETYAQQLCGHLESVEGVQSIILYENEIPLDPKELCKQSENQQ